MTHDAEEQGNPLAYEDMCKARQEFLAAWRAWLVTGPSLFAKTLEQVGTESTMKQLAQLSDGE
jgi:hypothetical protein